MFEFQLGRPPNKFKYILNMQIANKFQTDGASFNPSLVDNNSSNII